MKIKVIAQYHPAAALHNPRLWADILEDWQHLPQQVPYDYTIVESRIIDLTGMEYALDVENDPAGNIGEWSIAYRDGEGRLCVMPFIGAKKGWQLKGRAIEHNAKYDTRVLARNGMVPPSDTHDSMIAAYCMSLGKQAPEDNSKTKSGSNMVGGLGLKYLARRHLGIAMKTWLQVKDHPELKAEYNAMDSVATLLLWEKWKPNLPWHYWNIDMPLLEVLMAIEDRGIQIDPDFLDRYARSLDDQLARIDLPFRPFANQEIQSYVYGYLGIEPWKFTKGGDPSTEADVLETIDDPVVQELLKFKGLYKERNTDAKGYKQAIDPEGRIHTELKQTATSTGRLSSANPNLQNVVKKGDMRKLFIAPEGKQLIRLDYKLIEFGMLAILSGDQKLIQAFLNGDVHQETADALSMSRDDAKHINYLIQNGGTAWGMSREYGIPIETAKRHYNTYYERFPALYNFQQKTVEEAKESKRVKGYFGRERRIDALFAKDWRIIQAGEREAKTFPMQNGAAEIVKLAMIDLHYKHQAPMLLQIHDELLFEIDDKDVVEYAHWLKDYVPKITEINGVQFPVEVGIGQNWVEASLDENRV